MALLNYTTTVSVDRSVDAVQKLLREAGAERITLDYEDAAPVGLSFIIQTPNGVRTFALPVDSQAVLRTLEQQRLQPRFTTLEHADRVAWRITKDWLEVQLAIIQTGMVTLDQVLLPYMLVDTAGTTVFELYATGAAPALEAGT